MQARDSERRLPDKSAGHTQHDEGNSNHAQRRHLRPGRDRGHGAGEFQGSVRDREQRASPRDGDRFQWSAVDERQEIAEGSWDP